MNKKTKKTVTRAKKTSDRPRSAFPLERVEIDHTMLDIIVTDDKGNLSRPTMTSAIDSQSRMAVGFNLGIPE